MGVLDRLDRRNQRLVGEQIRRDPTRLVPRGVVTVMSGVSIVVVAGLTVGAIVAAAVGGSGWAALCAAGGVVVLLVLLRDVIADVRDHQ